MNAWYETENMGLCYSLSEDAGAPELRSPANSAIHSRGGLMGRLLHRIFG